MTDIQNSEGIFLNWCKFHGRSEILARRLNIKQFYVFPDSKSVFTRYLKSTIETLHIIYRENPNYILVMQPPVFLLLIVYVMSKFKFLRIVGDLHTGVFIDPKWKWSKSLVCKMLQKDNCAIVTNHDLAEEVKTNGCKNVFILDDLIEIYIDESSKHDNENIAGIDVTGEFLLAPLAYAFDEPLDALLKAIELDKNIIWVLTGNAPVKIRNSAPRNAIFTGYLSNRDYRGLLMKASGVVALTNQENTMQRAGYEAMCAGKPLLISDKKVLRDFFEESAIYVDNSATEIYDGAKEILNRKTELVMSISNLRSQKMLDQEKSLNRFYEYLKLGNEPA